MTEHLVNEEERVTAHNEECLKDSAVILKQCKDYVQLKTKEPVQLYMWVLLLST